MRFNSMLKQDLEEIFRTSNSSDDLFDSFRTAIENKIGDEDLYKILLRNKALSADEISMFAEKICKEFPNLSYNIYFCVAQLFESISSYGKYLDRSFVYYTKAAGRKPTLHEPYMAIAKIYNAEFNIPKFESIVKAIEDALPNVDLKSSLCFALSDLYKKINNNEKSLDYQNLGETYQKDGK